MLQHNVMLTLVASATTEQRESIVAGLRALPDRIRGLEAIDVRIDAGLADGNAGIFFRMTFRDEESWRAYTPHDAHLTLATEHILPVLASKTALQYYDRTDSVRGNLSATLED
jgi:hypothetical protein